MSYNESQANSRIFAELNAAKRYGMTTVKDVQQRIGYATMATNIVNGSMTSVDSLSEYEWEKAFNDCEKRLRSHAALLVARIENELNRENIEHGNI